MKKTVYIKCAGEPKVPTLDCESCPFYGGIDLERSDPETVKVIKEHGGIFRVMAILEMGNIVKEIIEEAYMQRSATLN
jgi:hypothetical protein